MDSETRITICCSGRLILCDASNEFVSSSIPSWQILTAHAQPFRGPGIWLSVWRFLLTHCLYERAAEVHKFLVKKTMLFADNPGIAPISTKTWYTNRKTKLCSDKHSITREKNGIREQNQVFWSQNLVLQSFCDCKTWFSYLMCIGVKDKLGFANTVQFTMTGGKPNAH